MLRLRNFMGMSDGFNVSTVAEFEEKAYRDFKTIKDWILPEYKSILDIGSGLGGVDIVIANYTNISTINIIEGDGDLENRQTNYHQNIQPWCDRKLARSLIVRNVSKDVVVNDYPPDPSLTIDADLIISLKSWGHHYPVGVYIDLVKRSLQPGGRVIMDIRWRKGDGRQTMQDNGFLFLAKVYDTPKCGRAVFERM
jgi:SAM-dependent methyltransferase